MARHDNNRNRSNPLSNSEDDAWRRIDEERGGKHLFRDRDRNYSGYYGDANRREHLGKNRFGSDRVPRYPDNRFIDTDDNFISEDNIGTNVPYRGLNTTYFSDRPVTSRYINEHNRGMHSGKGPKGWKRSDERIREDVNDALYRSYDVDATDIEVSVSNGLVELKGRVDNRMMKREAENCADEVMGVSDVRNLLRIGPAETAH